MSRKVRLPLPDGRSLEVPEPLGIRRVALRRLDGSEWFQPEGYPLLLPVYDQGCFAVWDRLARVWTVLHPTTHEQALAAWRPMMQLRIDAWQQQRQQLAED